MTKKKFQTIFIVVCTIAFLPLIFPLFSIGNRATPLIGGLPFSFVWVISWVAVVAICAIVLYRIDPENRNGAENHNGQED